MAAPAASATPIGVHLSAVEAASVKQLEQNQQLTQSLDESFNIMLMFFPHLWMSFLNLLMICFFTSFDELMT